MILGAFVLIVVVIILVVALKPGMCGLQTKPACSRPVPMHCSGAPVDHAARVDAPLPVLAGSTALAGERDLAPIVTSDGQMISEAAVGSSGAGAFGEGFDTFENAPEGLEASMWPSGAVGGAMVAGGQSGVANTLNRWVGAQTQALNLKVRGSGMSSRARGKNFGIQSNPIAMAGQAFGMTDLRGASAPLAMSGATGFGLPDGHPALEGLTTAGATGFGLPDGHPDLENLATA